MSFRPTNADLVLTRLNYEHDDQDYSIHSQIIYDPNGVCNVYNQRQFQREEHEPQPRRDVHRILL